MYVVTIERQKRRHVARLISEQIEYFVYQITEEEFKNYSDEDIFILVDKVLDYLVKLNNIGK